MANLAFNPFLGPSMNTNTNAATVADDFRKIGDRAYCDYIQQMQRSECLGWEAKVAVRKFGGAELKAHTKAGELLGRHRAFHEAAAALTTAAQQPAPREPLTHEQMLSIAKACGIQFYPAQFSSVLETETDEHTLYEFAKAIMVACGATAHKGQSND